jgi:hypothetical protein
VGLGVREAVIEVPGPPSYRPRNGGLFNKKTEISADLL